jgi:glycosyltransferase involved in cell wall biosynthesis
LTKPKCTFVALTNCPIQYWYNFTVRLYSIKFRTSMSERIELNTDFSIAESLGKTVSHAIKEILSNCVDEDQNASTKHYEVYWEARNKSLKGLTKKSFSYSANVDKQADKKTIGKFGYGLKDAIAILYAYGIGYEAYTEHGSFKVDHELTDGKITVTYLAGDRIELDGYYASDQKYVVQKLFLKKESDIDDGVKHTSAADFFGAVNCAESQILFFRPDILSMKSILSLNKKGVAQGTVYYHDEPGYYKTSKPSSTIFIHNLEYRFEENNSSDTPGSFLFVYNLNMDKNKLRGRDRVGIPLGWQTEVSNLIRDLHNSNKILEILSDVKARQDFDKIFELHNRFISNYVEKFVACESKKREDEQSRYAQLVQQKQELNCHCKKLEKSIENQKEDLNTDLDNNSISVVQEQCAEVEIQNSESKFLSMKRKLEDIEKEIEEYKEITEPLLKGKIKKSVWMWRHDPNICDASLDYNVVCIDKSAVGSRNYFDELPSYYERKFMVDKQIDEKYFKQVRAVLSLLRAIKIPYMHIVETVGELVCLVKGSSSCELHINFSEARKDNDKFLTECFIAISKGHFSCMLGLTDQQSLALLAVRTLSCIPVNKETSYCGNTSSSSIYCDMSLLVRKFCPLLVATEWNTKSGGISAYNIQLARGLAALNIKVYVLVLNKMCTEGEERSAAKDGVTIIEAWKFRCDYHPVMNGYEKAVSHVVGHAHITGKEALQISKLQNFNHTKLWQFNHVIPNAVDHLKESGSDEERRVHGENKEKELKYLNKEANFVWSVGNYMYTHFQSYIPGTKHRCFVLPLNPFHLKMPTEKTERDCNNAVVLFVGRAENTYYVKGMDIAILACAALQNLPCCRSIEIKLVLRGVPPKERKDIETKVLPENRSKMIEFRDFGSPEEVVNDLLTADVFIMPSRCEPFGLVGTEAIACGVPTLVSSNTGLSKLLHDAGIPDMVVDTSRYHVENSQAGTLQSDIDGWAEALRNIIIDKKTTAFRTAVTVRDRLTEYIATLHPYETMIEQGNHLEI